MDFRLNAIYHLKEKNSRAQFQFLQQMQHTNLLKKWADKDSKDEMFQSRKVQRFENI